MKFVTDDFSETALAIKKRINASLAVPRSKAKKRKVQEFWYGSLVACMDYNIIVHTEYQWMRDLVTGG